MEKILQIRNKIPRRKAISSLEDKVLTVLTESGQITKDAPPGNTESLADLIEDENEDEEVVVDGAVDEGDVHIKPVSRKYDMVSFGATLFCSIKVKPVKDNMCFCEAVYQILNNSKSEITSREKNGSIYVI